MFHYPSEKEIWRATTAVRRCEISDDCGRSGNFSGIRQSGSDRLAVGADKLEPRVLPPMTTSPTHEEGLSLPHLVNRYQTLMATRFCEDGGRKMNTCPGVRKGLLRMAGLHHAVAVELSDADSVLSGQSRPNVGTRPGSLNAVMRAIRFPISVRTWTP